MLNPIYNNKVSILNKLKAEDTESHENDIWYKTVLNNVAWYSNTERTVDDKKVLIGQYKTILIPFNELYLSYYDWKNSKVRQNYFTMSPGDYIIKGDIDEEVTPENVVKITRLFGENCCQVKSIINREKRFFSFVGLRVDGV